jgi:hypothetical protein
MNKIDKRMAEMPKQYRNCYKNAMDGRHRAAGIKAFCQMCVGWDKTTISDIKNCTDPACPLFPYRGYKTPKTSNNDHIGGSK